MFVAIDWPNMWLSGRRLTKRRGWKGRAYLRYLSTSRSTGTTFASTFRWRITTPFGSAVAPDVKMICVRSSRDTATAGRGPSASQSTPLSGQTAASTKASPYAGTSSPTTTTLASTTRLTFAANDGDER